NATLLADGKVLVTGGSRGTENPNAKSSDPAYPSELWDPATGNWTTMATLDSIRCYHAIALLLPDGRVLSAGGETAGNNSAEIYSPPYLFKGTRPTITSAPGSVAYGNLFFVGTPNAASITNVTMIALSSVTHGFNMSQRIIRPSFSLASGGINVAAPSSRNIAPPGYYMLFILNGNGVPSVAKIIQVSGSTPSPTPTPTPTPTATATPTPTPTAPTSLAATAVSSSQINLAWADNSNNESGFKIERSTDGTSFTQVTTVTANTTSYFNTGLTVSTKYYYRVRAYNSGGNSGYSNTVNATTAAPPTPTPTPTPTPANTAPVVSAGFDQTVPIPSATLSGSATDDGLPNPPAAMTYTWSKTSGPGTVTFADAQAATTTATFSVGGVYTLKLTAT